MQPFLYPGTARFHIIRRFTQYYRNDYAGVEQWSRDIIGTNYAHHIELHKQHEQFAKLWDKNLRAQGFLEAFERQRNRA